MAARILVVDDSSTVLRVVDAALSGAGYRVTCARSGREGLQLARSELPELALVDFAMPEMNGYQFCRELAADLALQRVPVVLMTAKGELPSDRFSAAPAVVDFIAKPFSPEALVAVTSHTLEKLQRRRAFEERPTDVMAMVSLEASHAPIADQVVATLARALEAELWRRAFPDPAVTARAVAEETLRRFPPEPNRVTQTDVALWCDLEQVALPEVLQLLALQRRSGLFQVAYDTTRFDIYLREGQVVAVRAENTATEYRLGRFLVERGVLSHAELEQLVRSASQKGGLPIGAKLLRLGLVDPEVLTQAVADQCSELCFEALRARRGACWLRAGVEPPAESTATQVQLQVPELLLEGLRRVDEWGVIEAQVGDFDTVFVRRPSGMTAVKELTSDERRLLELIDGQRSVRELLLAARLRPFDGCKLLYRLAAVHQIERRTALLAMPVAEFAVPSPS